MRSVEWMTRHEPLIPLRYIALPPRYTRARASLYMKDRTTLRYACMYLCMYYSTINIHFTIALDSNFYY